jgi:16S rRNA (cytosine1402-N4)-methyltransferase
MTPDNTSDGRPHRRRERYSGRYPRRPDQRYKELQAHRYPGLHEHVRAQGRTPAGTHVPVLMAEVLEVLRPEAGQTAVDGTMGYGGHAMEILARLGPAGRLMGLDVDEVALDVARKRLAGSEPRIVLRRSNYAGIAKRLAEEGWPPADIVLADLGVSSMQLDDPARGFSYKFDGPLDMRMDSRLPRSAADLLRLLSEADLASAFEELADEPDAGTIARAIGAARRRQPIVRTLELVEVIFAAKGLSRQRWRQQANDDVPRGGSPHAPRESAGPHPAALTFQALRILVNDELGALAQFLRIVPSCLAAGGRLAVITFHSGEDRLVKKAFREGVRQGTYVATNDEVVRPGSKERAENPRSASAKLQWAVRA